MSVESVATPGAPGAVFSDKNVPLIKLEHPFNQNQLEVLAAACNTIIAKHSPLEVEEILAELPIDAPDVSHSVILSRKSSRLTIITMYSTKEGT